MGVDETQILDWLRRWPRITYQLLEEEWLGVERLALGIGFRVPDRRGKDKQPRGRRQSTTRALGQRAEELIAAGMRPTAADQQAADEANEGRTFPADRLVKPTTVGVYRLRLRNDRARQELGRESPPQ